MRADPISVVLASFLPRRQTLTYYFPVQKQCPLGGPGPQTAEVPASPADANVIPAAHIYVLFDVISGHYLTKKVPYSADLERDLVR